MEEPKLELSNSEINFYANFRKSVRCIGLLFITENVKFPVQNNVIISILYEEIEVLDDLFLDKIKYGIIIKIIAFFNTYFGFF